VLLKKYLWCEKVPYDCNSNSPSQQLRFQKITPAKGFIPVCIPQIFSGNGRIEDSRFDKFQLFENLSFLNLRNENAFKEIYLEANRNSVVRIQALLDSLKGQNYLPKKGH